MNRMPSGASRMKFPVPHPGSSVALKIMWRIAHFPGAPFRDRSAGHHIILTAAPSRQAFPVVFSFRFSGRHVVGNVESLWRSRRAQTFEALVTVKRP
jgi:hypothetical protein